MMLWGFVMGWLAGSGVALLLYRGGATARATKRAEALTITCRDKWSERLSFAWMLLFRWPPAAIHKHTDEWKSTGEWEVGRGTYSTGNQFTRDPVRACVDCERLLGENRELERQLDQTEIIDQKLNLE